MISSLALCVTLTACGGGGGDGDAPSNNNSGGGTLNLTDAQVRTYLQTSQAANIVPYWDTSVVPSTPLAPAAAGVVDSSKTYRWSVENGDLIPIKDATNSSSASAYITQALDEIEQQLGKQIFDRISLANVPVANVPRGIIIRNVALSGNTDGVSNNCGHYHVSDLSFSAYYLLIDATQTMSPMVSADWENAMSDVNYSLRPQSYVDVNFSSPSCGPFKELVVHELGHALGLNNHFDGFGQGSCSNGAAVCASAFYQVLKALYNNPVATTYSSLVVQ